ncbi:hypothetical protein BDP81DRAFT_416724, partial [Colletotrichum phormii]
MPRGGKNLEVEGAKVAGSIISLLAPAHVYCTAAHIVPTLPDLPTSPPYHLPYLHLLRTLGKVHTSPASPRRQVSSFSPPSEKDTFPHRVDPAL